jgi:type I restriction enzyme S subunit
MRIVEFIEKFISDRVQDEARCQLLIEYICALWEKFSNKQLNDSHFESEFTSGSLSKFYQRFTEMFLACHLIDAGFSLLSRDEGPDLLIQHERQKIWIEIVTPEPKGIPEYHLNPPKLSLEQPKSGFSLPIFNVPSNEILLRWTAALKEKYEKLEGRSKNGRWIPGYRQKGIVTNDDIYVIAVNGIMLCGFRGISGYPYALESVYPIGAIEVTFSRETDEIINRSHQYRPHIPKRNGSDVPTDSFLNPAYAGIGAILGMSVGLDTTLDNKSKMVIVHNYQAHNPLPRNVLMRDIDEYAPVDCGDFLSIETA